MEQDNKKLPGRRNGKPNKVTTFSRLVITEMLSDYQASGRMEQDIEELEPKERLHIMTQLMAYVTPKPQAIDVNITTGPENNLEKKLAQLATDNE